MTTKKSDHVSPVSAAAAPADDRAAILSRRDFLIKAAMVSAGITLAGAAACDDTKPGPGPGADTSADGASDLTPDFQACLSMPADASDVPQVCLSPIEPDASDIPQMCLSAPQDTSDVPQMCLSIMPSDADVAPQDDMPAVCLSAPAPDADIG